VLWTTAIPLSPVFLKHVFLFNLCDCCC